MARSKPRFVPRWLPPASLALAVLGLAVSAYLTYEHFTGSTTLACSASGTVNCLKVTTSAQSRVVGVPVALLGLLFFAAIVPLMLPRLWADRRMSRLRIGAIAVGVVFVLYLVYAELFEIGNICLWCTAVHVITVGLFAVTVFGSALIEDRP